MFDGLEFDETYGDLSQAIEREILAEFNLLKKRFEFGALSVWCKRALINLARGDRKISNVFKRVPRAILPRVLRLLTEKNIIFVEKTREIRPKNAKNHKLKKSLRRHRIQDKLQFCDNFSRFWFRFCEPNLTSLQNGRVCDVLNSLHSELERYFCLPFELACADFLSVKFGINRREITSFWNKDAEIDIFVQNDDFTIVGEVKYKAKKVCKDVLNSLIFKCEKIGLKPDFYVLFSKNGFSSELKSLKNDKILLFELENFKELL